MPRPLTGSADDQGQAGPHADDLRKPAQPADVFQARIGRLERVFDLGSVLSRGRTSREVISYYNQSSLGYHILHSREGAIHMALNPDGIFSPEGYGRAAQLVMRQFPEDVESRILELGCGRGYNIASIARAYPACTVLGIDIVPRHVKRALRATRDLPNATAQLGDFERMPYEDGSFDVLYSIESFCHTLNLPGAFAEARRVSRLGTRFIVIDAWRTDKSGRLPAGSRRAVELLEASMSVGNVRTRKSWLHEAAQQGWQLCGITPLSAEVLPNLERFESWSKKFLKWPWLARAVRHIGPSKLWQNAIAGYLMAESVRQSVHSYDIIVLEARA